MLNELLGNSKGDAEHFELFRALNELTHRIMNQALEGEQLDEFFAFARTAHERQLLGFYLTRQQRMIDLGCDQVSAYHWSYCDVLNYNL